MQILSRLHSGHSCELLRLDGHCEGTFLQARAEFWNNWRGREVQLKRPGKWSGGRCRGIGGWFQALQVGNVTELGAMGLLLLEVVRMFSGCSDFDSCKACARNQQV